MDWRESRAGKRWLAVNKVRVVHDLWHGVPRVRYFVHPKRQRVKMTWLARARLLSGQSVAQAAKACGLSPRTWEAWERVGKERREPDVDSVLTLLHAYSSGSLEAARFYTSAPYVTVSPATLDVLP